MAVLAICTNPQFSGDELILGEYYLVDNYNDIYPQLLVSARYVPVEHLLRENFEGVGPCYEAVKTLYAKLNPLKFQFAVSRFELIIDQARFAEALARAEDRRKLGETRK